MSAGDLPPFREADVENMRVLDPHGTCEELFGEVVYVDRIESADMGIQLDHETIRCGSCGWETARTREVRT